MRLLITGATGFIGNALVRELINKRYKVRIFTRTSRFKIDSIDAIVGDITDLDSCKKACEGIDVVIHCAGVLGGWGIANQKFWDVNVNGTENMLKAASEAKVKKFIHISSCGVFGPMEDEQIANENCPYNPTNIYEKTKIEGEKIVLKYAKKIPIIIIRPDFVYGPGDLHLLKLFKTVKERRFVFFNDGKSKLHPTYINDLVVSILSATKSKKAVGETFNIAGPRPVTVKEFITTMAKALGVGPPTLSIPSPIPEIAGFVLDNSWGLVAKPPLTLSQVKYLTKNRTTNWEKAKKILRYKPKTDVVTGMRNTVKWYRENNLL
ncbi:MAG: NAD(P)-dependent oxidoreductase [Candidatus Micrarchaeota archaeon]